jgi:hypothetical protein
MSRTKQTPKRKHRACAVPLLGAAGLSLSLASGASVISDEPAAAMPTQTGGVTHEITLGEEEISDVSLATFFVFDKENPRPSGLQLAKGGGGCGCGGCGHGCGGGCGHGGCHAGGCGGCHGGCRGCHGGCGGCGGCGVGWWGGCGGCGVGSCWIWTQWGWVWSC